MHQAGLVKGTQCRHKSKAVKTRNNTDDIGRVLSYKRRWGVAGRGSDFDIHTNVSITPAASFCPQKMTGKAAPKRDGVANKAPTTHTVITPSRFGCGFAALGASVSIRG
jgi:hypothetical protein